MKKIIGLVIILITTAGCVSMSPKAQKPTPIMADAADVRDIEDRMEKLEARMQLFSKDFGKNYVLEQRIKKLEELLYPEHSIVAVKDKITSDDALTLEGRVIKLEGQVKQLQEEIVDFYKRQRPPQLIPIEPDPKPRVVPIK